MVEKRQDVVHMLFVQRGEMWELILTTSDGQEHAGEPFAASGREGFTQLEQVLFRIGAMGYKPKDTPYDRVNERRYSFDVIPI